MYHEYPKWVEKKDGTRLVVADATEEAAIADDLKPAALAAEVAADAEVPSQGPVVQEYPKWVEKDGKRFIVDSAEEEALHFPSPSNDDAGGAPGEQEAAKAKPGRKAKNAG